jgi:formylglycine-generating enzyme
MRRNTWIIALILSLSALGVASIFRADTFGSGVNQFEIDFVRIGSPGNPPDANPNPAGAVPYEYRIGKYEVSEQMIAKANAEGGLGITMDSRGPDFPATSITWFEAAQFVNWMNTSSGNDPAYKFDNAANFQLWALGDPGFNPANPFRSSLAHYFLPSINEWHKAAYYDPAAGHYRDYPTGSDAIPDGVDFVGDPTFDLLFDDGADNPGPSFFSNVGVLSLFGTAGQGGNVIEWEETAFDLSNDNPSDSRGFRGGSWTSPSGLLSAPNRNGLSPSFEGEIFGLRVASIVPEPSTIVSVCTILCLMTASRARQRWHE